MKSDGMRNPIPSLLLTPAGSPIVGRFLII